MTSSASCNSFAAKAKYRIQIEKPVTTDDDYGGANVTWQELETVWGYAEPVSTKQVFVNDKLVSIVTNKLIIRWRPDLAATDTTAKYRALMDGRYFPINSVENLDNDMKTYGKVYQRLRCDENGADNA